MEGINGVRLLKASYCIGYIISNIAAVSLWTYEVICYSPAGLAVDLVLPVGSIGPPTRLLSLGVFSFGSIGPPTRLLGFGIFSKLESPKPPSPSIGPPTLLLSGF